MFDERLVLNNESLDNVIYDEHLVRYQLAARFVKGKKVLDVASGSGYGSNILAKAGAAEVVGIDQSVEAVEGSNKSFQAENLKYKVGNAEDNQEPEKYFDVVVSFETIEHLNNPDKYLAEISRVLAEKGIALISTPNRDVFGQKNPFHLHEFSRTESEAILQKYFKNIHILEQTNGIASLIKGTDSGKVYFSNSAKPMYFIAAVSNNNPDISLLFSDSLVSVNPVALDKLRNNPVLKFVDKIYSFIKK